jgi:WD40 repeat protein/tRNA A-37 threonylcarbamoyl transferase component Bud32
MPDLVGHVLKGRYRIDDLLGRGGMAEVYKAWDQQRQYYVAIKVMREDLAEDVEFLARFRREASALAALNHANIVRFYSFEREGRLAFIVMDYVPGTTLRGRILDAGGKPLPLEEVAAVMRQACAALHYAHGENVLHRDVKPGNIMIRGDSSDGAYGQVQVADFGIAKAADAATATTAMPGTPAYMSPEQCRSEVLDERADVYALGIAAYEMLAGRRPFRGETRESGTESTREKIRWEQMHAEPPPLQPFNPAISPGLEAVVLKALAKDRDERWPTPLAFWQAFEEALAAAGVRTTPPVLPVQHESTAPPPPVSRPAGLPGWAWALMATGILVVVVVVIWMSNRPPPPVPEEPSVPTPVTVVAEVTKDPTQSPPTPEPAVTVDKVATEVALAEAAAATLTARAPTFTPTPTRTPTATPTRTASPTPTATPTAEPAIIRASNAASIAQIYKLTGHQLEVLDLAFAPDSTTLASASDDKDLRLWEAVTGQSLGKLGSHDDTVYSVAYSPDGKTVASASRDTTARLWQASSGSIRARLTGHTRDVWCVAYSPNGRWVATGSGDRTARLWQASNGSAVRQLAGHSRIVYSVAFSPDSTILATGSRDNTIRLWQVSNDAHLGTLTGHGESVRSVAFSPDGRLLASASGDGTIKLWQMSNRQVLRTLIGHNESVLGVAFSPDGSLLASASSDRTVRLWRVSDGDQLKKLTGHNGRVTAVAFSPNGRLLASSSDDRTVRVWGVLNQ